MGKSSSSYFLTQKFPQLASRIEPITYNENNSFETLKKILAGKHVLITPREYAEMIQQFYSNVQFHVSKVGFYSTLGNFAIRYGLNKVVRDKLDNL